MQDSRNEYKRNAPSRVAICIATFQRTEQLRDLLAALGRLSFYNIRPHRIDVIVVDNDAARSANSVCDIKDYPWTIRYVCEPKRGIARARNRAITEAADAEFLAFVDDDETPEPRWLDELLWTRSQFQADVVSGPVVPEYTGDVPEWIRNGGFFRRPVFRTGDVVELCSTNNVLIRSAILAKVSGFDEQFNLTGGEDTHFFLRVRKSGCHMVFSSAALVHERITAKRANLSWLLRRGYQSGNSWALCERDLKPEPRVTVARGFKGIAHICRGLARVPASLCIGKAALVRALQELCAGAGMLAGVVGYRFLPYRDAGINAMAGPTETTHRP
jgi:succinoglycan biosynthesis protein ExoM